jgi:plasmid replication initiation protein
MGCERIILCGCPNDRTPRFFETECENNAYVETQVQITREMSYKPEFKEALRSCSGWSREFFGGP